MSAISLTIYLGVDKPAPAPRELTEALESVEVTLTDSDRSGFKMVFQVGRSGADETKDYKLLDILNDPRYFTPLNRVILVVTLNGNAQTLVSGVIQQQEFMPSPELGRSTFTIVGDDISGFMDRINQPLEHVGEDEKSIVKKILNSAKYAAYNIQIPPDNQFQNTTKPFKDPPSPNDRTPTQQTTDFKYINQLAQRFGYVFYINPGPGLLQNTAYWGPPTREKIPQPVITVNMGGLTNASSINFSFNAPSAIQIDGSVQDRKTNKIQPVKIMNGDRLPLAEKSGSSLIAEKTVPESKETLQQMFSFRETARDTVRAIFHAQSQVNQSNDNVVTVSGELDTVRYGALLQLRGLVNLRGVGYTYDGTYYVKNVTHKIRKGDYKQSFTLTREGIGGKRSA
jgi:hypothetical protein